MNNLALKRNQTGAALVIGLLLLVVITVLAVSGMNTATTELTMARNDQNYESAFQAAETGLAMALGQPTFETEVNTIITHTVSSHETVQAVITYECATIVTDRAFSLGGNGVVARHFNTISTADSKRVAGGGSDTDRDVTTTHTQAFYVIGPPDQGVGASSACSI